MCCALFPRSALIHNCVGPCRTLAHGLKVVYGSAPVIGGDQSRPEVIEGVAELVAVFRPRHGVIAFSTSHSSRFVYRPVLGSPSLFLLICRCLTLPHAHTHSRRLASEQVPFFIHSFHSTQRFLTDFYRLEPAQTLSNFTALNS